MQRCMLTASAAPQKPDDLVRRSELILRAKNGCEQLQAELSRNPRDGSGHAAGLISTLKPRLRIRAASLAAARAGSRRGK
jgi:hypothetical protein